MEEGKNTCKTCEYAYIMFAYTAGNEQMFNNRPKMDQIVWIKLCLSTKYARDLI